MQEASKSTRAFTYESVLNLLENEVLIDRNVPAIPNLKRIGGRIGSVADTLTECLNDLRARGFVGERKDGWLQAAHDRREKLGQVAAAIHFLEEELPLLRDGYVNAMALAERAELDARRATGTMTVRGRIFPGAAQRWTQFTVEARDQLKAFDMLVAAVQEAHEAGLPVDHDGTAVFAPSPESWHDIAPVLQRLFLDAVANTGEGGTLIPRPGMMQASFRFIAAVVPGLVPDLPGDDWPNAETVRSALRRRKSATQLD
jgi:hypothetical protein